MTSKILRFAEVVLSGLNHDFCPGVNKYVYWMKRPVGWVVGGIAASLLVGLFIGPQGFVLMGSFGVLFLLGAIWPWLSLTGLSCRILLNERRSEENKTMYVTLEVTNRWPVPAFGLMVSGKFLQDVVKEDDLLAVALRKIPAWSVSRFEWPIEPKRRGIIPLETPILATGFPFDISVFSKPIEMVGHTIVWPACTPLEGVPDLGGSQFNIDGISSIRAGNDGETIGARSYRHGDSIKNIHWSRTAQFDRLIVREKQSSTQSPICVVVDLIPDHHRGLGINSTYECAIRAAASVVKHLHLHHSLIEVMFVGLPDGFPSRITNRNGLGPLMDFLAKLPTQDHPAHRMYVDPELLTRDHQFTILIRTKSSKLNVGAKKRVFEINIDAEQADEQALDKPSTTNPGANPPAITMPQYAGEQLNRSWMEGAHA